MTTNESANRIYAGNATGDGNLGTDTGFTGDTLNFHGAIFHFWHFATEQPFDKLFVAARND